MIIRYKNYVTITNKKLSQKISLQLRFKTTDRACAPDFYRKRVPQLWSGTNKSTISKSSFGFKPKVQL